MGKETDNSHDQADSISPEEADRKGKVNIVKGIIDDPEVQTIIKGSLVRETIKNSVFMAAFLVGLLKLYDVAKTIINFNWIGDLIMSLVLIATGVIYMARNLMKGSKQADSKS